MYPKFPNETINDELIDSLSTMKNVRVRNVNRVAIGNSPTNKFKQLKKLVLKYEDILILTETKLAYRL